MKVAFDTNAIIKLCDNDQWSEDIVCYLQENAGSQFYLLAYVSEELAAGSFTTEQLRNYNKLQNVITPDSQSYFMLNHSRLDGSDVLRGDGAERLGIETIYVDKAAEYEKNSNDRKAKGLAPKDTRTWLRRNVNQIDSVIFERAEQLKCTYVVSDNRDILKAQNSECLPIKLSEFIVLIKS